MVNKLIGKLVGLVRFLSPMVSLDRIGKNDVLECVKELIRSMDRLLCKVSKLKDEWHLVSS